MRASRTAESGWAARIVLLAVFVFTPTFVSAQTLAWDPSVTPAVLGYTVHMGTTPGSYTQTFDVGGSTTFTFGQAIPGTRYYFVVTAYDAANLTSAPSNVVSWKINVGPVLAQPSNVMGSVGAPAALQLVANDDGDPLTFTAAGLPPGLSINTSTGSISGTPTTVGSYTVIVTVSDGALSDFRTFTWVVGPRLSVTSLITSAATPQRLGATIALTAAAVGGTAPYQYKFLSTAGGTTTTLRGWDVSPSYSWTPTQVATYNLTVWARSAGVTADVAEGSMVMTFAITAPPGTLALDSFTGGTGSLASHALDFNANGTPWVVTGSTPAPTISGGVARVGIGSGHLQATINTAVSDFIMGVDYRVGTGPQLGALAFRLTDANNHLLLMFYRNGLHFYRKQGGVYALLASQSMSAIAAGSTHRLEVRATGSTLEGWWDGVRVVQTTSTFQQTATRHGLDWNSAYDATATYDNFQLSPPAPLTPPAVPGSASPVNGATSVATATSLSWSASRATSYDVRFGTSNPPPAAASNLTSSTYAPGTLAASTKYFWQVIARNSGGTTAGPVWSFTTASPPPPPAAPTSPNPANGATSVSIGTTLTWAAGGATSYDVSFGTSNPPPQVATGRTTATYTPSLAANSTYYWQIVARNAGGAATGPIWSFKTANVAPGILVSDTFTDVSERLLTSHAPDFTSTGAPWAITGATPAPILSNGLARVSAGSGHLQATLPSGVSDFIMGVDYRVGATKHLGALAFRLTDGNNHLLLVAYNNRLEFHRKQNGTYTLLASQPVAPMVAGSTHRLEVRATGSTLEGWWDGVRVAQTTSTFQQTATRHGLDWNSAYDATATYDNFQLSLPAPTASGTVSGSASSTSGTASGTTSVSTTTTPNTTTATGSDLLVFDTFPGTGGTLLSAHAPEVNGTGNNWTITGGSPEPRLSGVGAVGVTTGSGHLQATIDSGLSDFRMAVDYRVGGSVSLGALVFRLTDGNNHLLLVAYQNVLEFYRRQGGVYTRLAQQSVSIVNGRTHRLEVRATGSMLEGWWDGERILEIVEPFQQTATRHGLDWNSAYDPRATYDNFELRSR